jgi:hypothetical protein
LVPQKKKRSYSSHSWLPSISMDQQSIIHGSVEQLLRTGLVSLKTSICEHEMLGCCCCDESKSGMIVRILYSIDYIAFGPATVFFSREIARYFSHDDGRRFYRTILVG